MELGEAVRTFREEHNYSLREFAELCGLSHVQIYRIEHGVKTNGQPFKPTMDTLEKLATGMGVSLDYIFRYYKNFVVKMDEGAEYKPSKERQAVIDKIILATPEQFALIQSYVDFVTK